MRSALFRDPAFHGLVAVGDAARAVVVAVGREPRAQPRQRGHGLVGGPRRIPLNGAVGQRIGFVAVHLVPVFHRDAGDENIRVIRGHRGHRENVAILRVDHHRRAAPHRAQRPLGDELNFRVDREIDIVAGLRCLPADFAHDYALGTALHHAHARRAANPLVIHQFHLALPLHVRLVKGVVLDVRELVDVIGGPDVAEQMRRQRAIDVLPHRLDRDVHARQTEVVFGKAGDRFIVQLLLVGEGNEPRIAVVQLQPLGIVILREIQLIEPRHDCRVHDLHDVGLPHVGHHAPDRPLIPHHRDLVAKLRPIAAFHVGQIEIHTVAGPVGDERQAIAVANLPTHRRNADRDLGLARDFLRPLLAAQNLLVPQLSHERAKATEHGEAQENDAPLSAGTAGNTACHVSGCARDRARVEGRSPRKRRRS